MRYCWLLLFLLLEFMLCPALAQEAEDDLFWPLQVVSEINQLRTAPLEEASRLGIPSEELTSLWSQNGPRIMQGLTPLTYDPRLDAAAAELLQLFPTGNITSEELKDLVIRHDYPASLAGSICRLIGWENFYSLEQAVDTLLDELFREALRQEDPAATGFLFPGYLHVGFATDTTLVEHEGQTYHAYRICFILASPDPPPGVIGRITAGESFFGEVYLFSLDLESCVSTYVFPDGSFLFEEGPGAGYLVPVFLGESVPPFEITYSPQEGLILIPVAIPPPF